MPFRSKAQMRFLFAKHPDIAKKWAAEGYTGQSLPNKVSKVSKVKRGGISNLHYSNSPKKRSKMWKQ